MTLSSHGIFASDAVIAASFVLSLCRKIRFWLACFSPNADQLQPNSDHFYRRHHRE